MNRCGGAANSPDDIDALFEQAYQNMQGDQSYQADVSLSQFLSPEPPPVPRQQRPTRTNQFFNQQTGAQCNFVTPRPPRTPPQFSPNMSYGNVTQSTMNYSGNESMMSGFQPLPVTPEQCPMPPPKGAAASRKPGPAAPPPKAPRPGNTPESPLDWGPNADLALEEVCRIFGMTPKDFEVKPTKSQRVKKFLKKMTPACLTPMRAAPESPQSEDDEIYEFHDYEVSPPAPYYNMTSPYQTPPSPQFSSGAQALHEQNGPLFNAVSHAPGYGMIHESFGAPLSSGPVQVSHKCCPCPQAQSHQDCGLKGRN